MKRCEFCGSTWGQIEWHHPLPERGHIGLYLCQPCHSLLQGRKRKYPWETNEDKTLEEKRRQLLEFIYDRLGIWIGRMEKG